jgi:hypothetical protein
LTIAGFRARPLEQPLAKALLDVVLGRIGMAPSKIQAHQIDARLEQISVARNAAAIGEEADALAFSVLAIPGVTRTPWRYCTAKETTRQALRRPGANRRPG